MPLEIISAAILIIILVFVLHRFSNKKLIKKISELREGQNELNKLVKQSYNLRRNDLQSLYKRIDELDKKISVLSKPEGEEKELGKEKLQLPVKTK